MLSQNVASSQSFNLGIRDNADYAFTSSMSSMDDFERLARYYFGVDSRGWKLGLEVLKDITKYPYTFAVADCHNNARTLLTDYVSYARAPLQDQYPKFKIGTGKNSTGGGSCEMITPYGDPNEDYSLSMLNVSRSKGDYRDRDYGNSDITYYDSN
jgi:hypothetical protein